MTEWSRNAVVAVVALATLKGFVAPAGAQDFPASKPSPAVTAGTLPKDVYPDSLARLPLIQREDLDEHGQKLYDLIVSPQARSLAGLQGPYGIWLNSPPVAEHAQPLNYYLRYETALDRRLTELAILVTARQMDNQYEWTVHEPAARKEGLEPPIIDVVRYRKGLAGLGEKEALIVTFGRELFGKRKVSSLTFAHALKVFGKQGVVNLAALMGDYASIGTLINAFDISLRPDQKPLLPMP